MNLYVNIILSIKRSTGNFLIVLDRMYVSYFGVDSNEMASFLKLFDRTSDVPFSFVQFSFIFEIVLASLCHKDIVSIA